MVMFNFDHLRQLADFWFWKTSGYSLPVKYRPMLQSNTNYQKTLKSSVSRLLWAWQCSPMENYVVLLQGFNLFSLLDFVLCVVHIKKKVSSSSWLDGMPVVKALVLTSNPGYQNLLLPERLRTAGLKNTSRKLFFIFPKNI